MLRMWTALQSRIGSDEEGASLVEYALLVALIAIVALVAIRFLGNTVSDEFDSIGNQL